MTLNLCRANKNRLHAFAVLEYVILITIVCAALFSFRGYIQRGLQGQYRKAGETFGFLRQYNPDATIDCAFDPDLNVWYSQACFNNRGQATAGRRTTREVVAADDAAKLACQLGCTPK
jgi:hypothetical protein